MCQFDRFMYTECICDDIKVPADVEKRCDNVKGSSHRLKCATFPSPANFPPGMQVNPPTVVNGTCGKNGCLLQGAGHLKKAAKEAFEDYLKLGVRHFNTSWQLRDSDMPTKYVAILRAAFGNPTLSDDKSRAGFKSFLRPLLDSFLVVKNVLSDRRVKDGQTSLEHVGKIRAVMGALDELKLLESGVQLREEMTNQLVSRPSGSGIDLILEAAKTDAAQSWVEAIESLVPGFAGSHSTREACVRVFGKSPLGKHFS